MNRLDSSGVRMTALAGTNLAFAVASLARIASEALLMVATGASQAYYLLMILDALIAVLWVASALKFRQQGLEAMLLVALAGGAILAHSFVSLALMGPAWLKAAASPDLRVMSLALSRLLLYGVEIVFWPYACRVLLNLANQIGEPSPPGGPSLRWALRGALTKAFLLASVLQFSVIRFLLDS